MPLYDVEYTKIVTYISTVEAESLEDARNIIDRDMWADDTTTAEVSYQGITNVYVSEEK